MQYIRSVLVQWGTAFLTELARGCLINVTVLAGELCHVQVIDGQSKSISEVRYLVQYVQRMNGNGMFLVILALLSTTKIQRCRQLRRPNPSPGLLERPTEYWSSPLIYRTDGSPNCFHSSNGSRLLICPIWLSLIVHSTLNRPTKIKRARCKPRDCWVCCRIMSFYLNLLLAFSLFFPYPPLNPEAFSKSSGGTAHHCSESYVFPALFENPIRPVPRVMMYFPRHQDLAPPTIQWCLL
ncbi:uncharacterized protein BKA55DRAFT_328049 [Fusarium redolens]|uniref:Uncharacterized protein n=1 Tax=Fusarium redolens TaxID=48865 RepID=A0A9P9HDY1_FUSRE|nr:uncharacterized protein BKA55DRAFT_328049 [Fusarium redolens]KAH7255721.1 hypothetical protein BKA55DRAFT_328049 [Fusarium redolens]